MTVRIATVASIGVAVLSWALLGSLLYDAARVSAPEATAAIFSRADPCNLAEPLGTGFDRHCDLRVRLLADGSAVAVTLDETWEGNVLGQRLVVGADPPLWAVTTRSVSATGASRIAQLRALPAGTSEHLAYNMGNCGALVCGNHDVVVVGAAGGAVRELLRVRLGRGSRFELADGALALVEPFTPSGATAPTSLQVRTYGWDGGAYVQRGVELRPTPSPTPSPRT